MTEAILTFFQFFPTYLDIVNNLDVNKSHEREVNFAQNCADEFIDLNECTQFLTKYDDCREKFVIRSKCFVVGKVRVKRSDDCLH